jgi:hypothetical protein
MRTRTTQEDREALRKYFVELIIADEGRLPPRYEREKFMAQVLLDCQDAIDRVESLESRLRSIQDSASATERAISSLIIEACR